MRFDKKTLNAIKNEIEDRAEVTKQEIKELIKKYAPKPDVDALIEREYDSAVKQFMAKPKDSDNVRDWFAVKSNDETVYVNVVETRSLEYLSRIDKQLSQKRNGLNKSIKKTLKCENVLFEKLNFDLIDIDERMILDE